MVAKCLCRLSDLQCLVARTGQVEYVSSSVPAASVTIAARLSMDVTDEFHSDL